MSHTIIYNSEAPVIEINIQGDLTLNVIKEIASEAMLVAKEQNCFLILINLRKAVVKLSTLEILELPQLMSELADRSGVKIDNSKRALVVTKDWEEYVFFEAITVNSRQYLKLFSGIDEAKKWLSGK